MAYGAITTITELGLGIPGVIKGSLGDSQNPGTLKTDTHTGAVTASLSIKVT